MKVAKLIHQNESEGQKIQTVVSLNIGYFVDRSVKHIVSIKIKVLQGGERHMFVELVLT